MRDEGPGDLVRIKHEDDLRKTRSALPSTWGGFGITVLLNVQQGRLAPEKCNCSILFRWELIVNLNRKHPQSHLQWLSNPYPEPLIP